jgi:hypothetical protein
MQCARSQSQQTYSRGTAAQLQNSKDIKASTAGRKKRIVELTTLWTLLKLVAALSPLNSRAAGAAHATAEESAIVAMSKE